VREDVFGLLIRALHIFFASIATRSAGSLELIGRMNPYQVVFSLGYRIGARRAIRA
jgi:hypothetical protein